MGFGYRDEIKCPLCQHEFTHTFGITHYYYIEQLEEKYKRYSYTEVKCPSCKKTFWHNHKKNSFEKYDNDVAIYSQTICW